MLRNNMLVLLGLLLFTVTGTAALATEIDSRPAASDDTVAPQEMVETPLETVLASFARSPGELVTLRFIYYQLTLKSLAELMFLPDPQGEVDFTELSPAIAAYQLELGAEPTGKLLFGQYDQLMRRAQYVQRRNLGPTSRHVVDIATPQPGPVSLRGSWRSEEGSSWANITEIRCQHEARHCAEAHARVGRLGLETSLREWRVVEWSAVRLLAISENEPCLAQSLTVDLRNGHSEMVHTPATDAPACRRFGTVARHFRLVSSHQLFSQMPEDPLREYMNPAATLRLSATGQ